MNVSVLYDEHHDEVEALARRVTRSATDGEDIASRTFEELPRSLGRYRGVGDVRAFLLGVCRNLALRFRRSEGRRRAVLERLGAEPAPARESDPEELVARRELVSRLADALAALPPEQRNAFLLSTIEDCSAKEIADASGASEATVRSRIFLARKKLRESLERSVGRSSGTLALIVLALIVAVTTGAAVAAPRIMSVVARWYRSTAPESSMRVPAAPRSGNSDGVRPNGAIETPTPKRFPALVDEPPPIAPARRQSPRRAAEHASPPRPVRSIPGIEHEYLTAHALHFVSRDYAGALVAWDAYLAAAPSGRLALEARYNRAVALLHLRRFAAAHAALVPFAEGTDGGYRQNEAKRLLTAIESR